LKIEETIEVERTQPKKENLSDLKLKQPKVNQKILKNSSKQLIKYQIKKSELFQVIIDPGTVHLNSKNEISDNKIDHYKNLELSYQTSYSPSLKINNIKNLN
jgi:hypothetical protein